MALTYRSVKGSALTITELDNNFRHFTGSHAITGSLDISGNLIVTGSITTDKIFCAGSETGMVEIPEKKIIEKGRLGPGQLIAVNLKKGKIYKDKEIKDLT